MITVVYGPIDDNLKHDFLEELKGVRASSDLPWVLLGDFNLIRDYSESSSRNRTLSSMVLFNSFISQTNIFEVPLQGRRFTWTSKRPVASFSKIDRAFLSHSFLTLSASYSLIDLPATTSDHVPLLLSFTPIVRGPKRSFKFESYWLTARDYDSVLHSAWSTAPYSPDPAINILLKLKDARKALTSWASRRFPKFNLFLRRTKVIIRFLDLIEESRPLESEEFLLRIALREHAYNLIQLQELKWRQRTGETWLKLGDKNTKYFHAVASMRRVTNHISSVSHQDRLITSPVDLKDVFYNHYNSLLGTPPASLPPFDLTGKLGPRIDLSTLGSPFTEVEILAAINGLPSGKSSGPDGFPIEFFKRSWDLIKDDFIRAFTSF